MNNENNKLSNYCVREAETKRLMASHVLHILTLRGRLFHRVVAAFLKDLSSCVTTYVCGMASSALGPNLSEDKPGLGTRTDHIICYAGFL